MFFVSDVVFSMCFSSFIYSKVLYFYPQKKWVSNSGILVWKEEVAVSLEVLDALGCRLSDQELQSDGSALVIPKAGVLRAEDE